MSFDLLNEPTTLSDKQLDENIKLAWVQTAGNHDFGGTYLGLIAEKNARNNRFTVRLSLAISLLAVLMAMLSLSFSFLDWKGDKIWQQEQIDTLKNMQK